MISLFNHTKRETKNQKGDLQAMKMRKLISLVLALALVFSLAAPTMAATKTDQQKAGDRLLDLGIISGDASGDLLLDKTLTRAELTVLLARLNGMGEAAELLHSQPSIFSDVKTGEWYTGWINLAASQGWIKGDPQGTFRPNDPVQYREAVTMIVKVLGYDDNLVGVWPTNYLAKATSLGLVKGLSYSDAKAAAVRGDIFLVSSRALDEKVVYWSSSENEYLYKESKHGSKISNITLLENALNLEKKVEEVVVDIPLINSRLDDNEIKLAGDNTTYTLKNAKPLDLFGKTVTLWVDKDDVVWAVQVDTPDSDVYMDTVANVDGNEIKLDVADKSFDVAKNASIYLNGAEVSKLSDIKGAYGRFVLDEDGDVAYAMLFSFVDTGIVTKVSGNVATYVDDQANKKNNELDLDDYKKGSYIFDKDLNEIEFSSIEADNGLYYAENSKGDVVYVLVNNDSIEGTLERVSASKVRVAGTSYDVASNAIYTADNGSNYSKYNEDDVEVLVDYEVKVVLNLAGDVIYVAGSSDETSGDQYGVVTYAERVGSSKVTIFTSEGKEVDYKFADRGDMPSDIVYSSSNFDYYGANSNLKYALIKYQVDKDGEIHESFKADSNSKGAVVTIKGVTEFKDDDVVVLQGSDDIKKGAVTKSADKDYVTIDGIGRFYFDEKTTIMTTVSKGELDPATMSYDNLYKSAIGSGDNGYAVIFGTPGKTASAIFFIQDGFAAAEDTYQYGVVTSNPVKDSNDWYADINIAGEGVKEVKLTGKTVSKGDLVSFVVNNKGKAEIKDRLNTSNKDFAKVDEVDGNSIRIGTTWYKVSSDVVVYALDAEDGFALDKVSKFSKVNENDGVILLTNKDGKVVAILLVDNLFKDGNNNGGGNGDNEGTVTYIDTTNELVYVDQAAYEIGDNTLLKTAKGNIIAKGFTNINAALGVNDEVKDIVVKDGVVTSFVATKIASIQTVVNPVDTAIEELPAVADVTLSDETDVNSAKSAYDALTPAAKDFVKAANVTKLNALVAKIAELKAENEAQQAQTDANNFKTTHSAILAKTVDTVAVGDQSGVTAANNAYNALSAAAKALLADEKALLDDLQERIDAIEAVNNATTPAAMRTAIEDAALGLDLTEYNNLLGAQKDIVAQYLIDNAPAGGYTDTASVQNVLDAAI